jgi:hypothetical protein
VNVDDGFGDDGRLAKVSGPSNPPQPLDDFEPRPPMAEEEVIEQAERAQSFRRAAGRNMMAEEAVVEQTERERLRHGLPSSWNLWKPACCMPKADDVNSSITPPQPVDGTIRTADCLPQIRVPELWHDATDFGETRQILRACDQLITEPSCGIGIMPGDISDNILQIGLRGWSVA